MRKKGAGTFVPNGNTPLDDEARQKARAALTALPEFRKVFGENHEEDPRFQEAVEAVMSGRTARLVLADYIDHTSDHHISADRGAGWAW